MTVVAELPYEEQWNKWSCGAASLAMVYRSFGIECNQDQIWRGICGKSLQGRLCARAQSLAATMLQSGLQALMLQVRDPWLVLERCVQQSVRVIINHVSEPKSGGGHFSVLAGLGDDEVIIHDPSLGPNRTLTRSAFLQLWNPRALTTEIPDQILIAIAKSTSKLGPCPLCDHIARDSFRCPSCQRSVSLQPLAILGCLSDHCPMRAWEQIFCPFCDHAQPNRINPPKPGRE